MTIDPTGRRIIVTGGASGLGAAVADALAVRGDHPIVLDRAAPRGERAHVLVDLADSDAAIAAVTVALDRHGPIDAVVTCAGIDRPAALDELPFDAWRNVIDVNLLGTAAVIHAALPSLKRQDGRIVTIASTLGHRAVDHGTAYCASKFGVVGFTRALMAELRGQVAVTLLTPGGMSTSFFDGREERFRPGADDLLLDPARVADAVVHVLSQPTGCEIRELIVAASTEGSWP